MTSFQEKLESGVRAAATAAVLTGGTPATTAAHGAPDATRDANYTQLDNSRRDYGPASEKELAQNTTPTDDKSREDAQKAQQTAAPSPALSASTMPAPAPTRAEKEAAQLAALAKSVEERVSRLEPKDKALFDAFTMGELKLTLEESAVPGNLPRDKVSAMNNWLENVEKAQQRATKEAFNVNIDALNHTQTSVYPEVCRSMFGEAVQRMTLLRRKDPEAAHYFQPLMDKISPDYFGKNHELGIGDTIILARTLRCLRELTPEITPPLLFSHPHDEALIKLTASLLKDAGIFDREKYSGFDTPEIQSATVSEIAQRMGEAENIVVLQHHRGGGRDGTHYHPMFFPYEASVGLLREYQVRDNPHSVYYKAWVDERVYSVSNFALPPDLQLDVVEALCVAQGYREHGAAAKETNELLEKMRAVEKKP